ncbi:MAG: DUF362 domain-containing protein [Candidatus Heimdallarchaeota archaeon]
MSKVAIVKVENGNIEKAVREIIDLLGGLDNFIADFQEILVKPNMLASPEKQADKDKVMTNPRIVDALCNMLVNLKKRVIIGDTCGAGHEGGTRAVLEKSGFIEIAAKYDDVVARSLELNGPIVVDVKGKKLRNANISKDVVEAEAIINVPKMKTHAMTLFTGAIKNLFGTICGADKTRIHSFGGSMQNFSQCLVDLYAYEKSKIKLNIMDAIVALEGMGPGTSGKAVKMNLLLASADAVALDAVAFKLMGHNPEKVPTTKYAAEQGLGVMDLDQIEIIGEKIETHQRKFKLPLTATLARIPFMKFTNIIKRVPKYKKGCTACGNCERACPEEVIKIVETKKGKAKPIIDLKGCISCFTCVEVCPEACYSSSFKNMTKTIFIAVTSIMVLAGLIITLVLLL